VVFQKSVKVVDLLAVDLYDFNSLNMYSEGTMEESKKYVRAEEINRVKNKVGICYFI
jgi:hypothetical protein